ncbi:hypothetical protein COW36_21260 [bacterium (Candidatus Blackallbacteria) CG17_big_fil_post_rev_8_21_14_2_50_48_46]|uniref:Uncharacterized protein n=1 Tax=bacterium (Candidatus Blackallbacteria) CG17_big_fil_post_rev_8_21_14_2_50_48_46 TaxID=2014261 RepID=A0A2M7G058_9BACT|nr:MAG: hypothetical protein COW64_14570 [bacterium (Candidatus Blackallbacteria) CG18_big_fil_WC_8_21_14_2_50_49_26]PIW14569.1 MAG: hypothetical protein COW36_21260 [bacterium (Candidatus Blackallbacteria) CG17_big_fil_post_rev_8_21_14_2_50_48_46]PIW47254.1 MAG: hypothetical protein COW20_13705 [bacterium (Candidatus Blackallbacteria) CG13_big_fil_rev_8_21_14_2_50_49_14]
MQIRLSTTELEIEGQPGILYGGEFQYFRIPATLWEESLRQLAEAQINFISCYIPWIWHEYEEGQYDFTGQTVPERDLERFLSLVESHDLALIVRPGPYVYGEYQGFGIPDWLRQKHPEILIVYETGLTSNEIALNHPVFLSYTRRWLEAVTHYLRPRLDNGRIIACQLDNETGLPQYGGVAYAGDFNPHTVESYHLWLRRYYPSIEHLNRIWHSSFEQFEEIEPPRKSAFAAVPFRQWAAFIEDYLVHYLESLKQMVRSLGVQCLLYLNDPYLCQWPNNSSKKARLALTGYDIYSKFTTDSESTHDVPFGISFAPEFYRSLNPQRLLMGVEVGSGWFDPRVKIRKEAFLQNGMVALLRGMRVLNWYLLHDCVETDGIPWVFQSPLDKDGQPVDRYPVMQEIGGFIQNHAPLLAQSEILQSPIGLLKYIPQGRDFLKSNFNVWSALDMMDNALCHFSGLTAMHGVLLESGYNPVVHDLERISLQELEALDVVFLASTNLMERDMYQKLVYYVENGGTLVSFGSPVATDLQGEPYAHNPLFPAKPYGHGNKLQYGTNTVLSQVALDIMDYQMMRRSISHKLSLHTLDMMHPFVEFTKYVGKSGAWIETERAEPFWASRFASFWQGGGISPVLRQPDGATVGYSKRLGRGRLYFLGTLPGLFFDTPGYYTIEPDKKQSVLRFFGQLLKENGLSPLVEGVPHTEVILRQTPEGSLIAGLINRGPAQEVTLTLNMMQPFQRVETLFLSHPETDRIEKARYQRLKGFLSKDAVAVVHLL